jgi:large subunit ribosomal protein L4
MQVEVINQSGDTVETIELNDAVFNVPMNPSLVHQAMVIYQANRRQGTHDTKTRAEVSGGGRKPWIQKHTGRARQGSTRAPQWRHGGVVFGPHPRSYRAALPKRMKRQALRCVLSDKARQDRLVCLDSTDTIDGKTKSMAQLLENLSVAGSALVVTKGSDRDVVLAAHNLKKIWTIPVNQLNAQELLARDMVIMTVEAARWAEETLAAEPHGRRGAKWANTASVAPVSNGSPVAEPVTEEAPAGDVPATEAPDTETPDIEAADTPVEEPAPSPRPRRRRTAASAEPESAAEAPITEPESPDSDEEA